MKIAITGSTGFIGANLLKSLDNLDAYLIVLDRKKNSLGKASSLRSFVSGADIIIHLAGVSRKEKKTVIEKVNVRGTKNLLEAIRLYNPGVKIILASTVQVNNTNDVYSVSKKEAEILIEEYAHKEIVKVIILRFSNVYGVGAKPFYNSVLNTFVYQIKNDQKIIIHGDGEQKRDYINVKDVVSAIIIGIKYQPKKIEIFNVCSGEFKSLNDILKILKNISAKNFVVEYDKSHIAQKDNPIKKIKQLPDWKASVNIESGLREILNED